MLEPQTIVQGRYQVVAAIGQGGMGAIYEAVDQRLRSRVALKQLALQGDEVSRAFEHEAQLLGNLRHPRLPRVIDHFTDEAGQFLVMDFIPGPDLGSLLQERNGSFPCDQVSAWIDQLLDVLDYLHGQQPPIIHRDIKPSNLKLDKDGGLILLDFGLAKGSIATEHGTSKSFFGYTPLYSPLEQIQDAGTDARADIYALGATFFHLLTGQPAADALSRATAVIARHPDPFVAPRTLCAEVPEQISQAISAALALSREDRPANVALLRALLHGLPTDAIDTTVPVGIARIAATPGAAPITEPLPEDTPANTPPEDAPTELGTSAASTPAPDTEPTKTLPAVTAPAALLRQPKPWIFIAAVSTIVILALGMWFWSQRDYQGRALAAHANLVRALAWSPDRRTVASGGADGMIYLWQADGSRGPALTGHTGWVQALAWSPDGQLLASGSRDNTLRLWRVDGTAVFTSTEIKDQVRDVAWNPSGTRIAAAAANGAVFLYRPDGQLLTTLELSDYPATVVDWSPDGATLAGGNEFGRIVLWTDAGAEVATLDGHERAIRDLDWSADSARLASASNDGTIRIWSRDGAQLKVLADHGTTVQDLAWSPDGTILASAGDDQQVRIWSREGALLTTLSGHTNRVNAVAWSPDGQLLASASADSTVRIWSRDGALVTVLTGHSGSVDMLAWSPDSQALASASADSTVRLWDIDR